MAGFSQDNLESIVSACRENAASIAEALNLCFDCKYRIEVGETSGWDPELSATGMDEPGLLVRFDVDTQSMLCLIPETLPLPEWYKQPGDSERPRLEALAEQWSRNMLPGDLKAVGYASTAVGNLKDEALQAALTEAVTALELLVVDAGDGESIQAGDTQSEQSPQEPKSRLLLVWPVTMAALQEDDVLADLLTAEADAGQAESPTLSSDDASSAPARTASRHGTKRLLNLPVTVIVQLADKKIELGQLLSLTPGALVAFNKSCEEMLDLYVNNRLYARGEAVKIGEKFGIKIAKVGIAERRTSKIV